VAQILILFACVMTLLASLLYVVDAINDYVNIATQVYCEQRVDFIKCSQEFREKTSKLMKER